MPASLDQVRPAVASASGSVDVELSFQCPALVVTRWRCRVREAGESVVISHRWHTMKFVHTGASQAHLSDGPVLLDSTRVLLAAPDEPYVVTKQFGSMVTGSAILVNPALMPRIAGEHGAGRTTRLLRADLTPRALLTQHLILRQIEEGAPALAIEELGLTLATEAFRTSGPAPHPQRKRGTAGRDAVAMAQAILAANYEKPVRLDDIARAVDISPYYLCRAFKQVTGMHMHRYLNRLRLRAALEHVAEPRLALAEIAHGHGFSSQSHFAAAFRREFLITPSEVRRLAGRNVSEMRRVLGLSAIS